MISRFKTLFLLCFIPLLSIAQPLSGTYIIGTASQAPFNSLPNAIQKINTDGVSGPVVFLLNDPSYTITGMLTINQFAGSSAINTFTIKPNTSKNVQIQANQLFSYQGVPAVFQIKGADNVIIDGSNAVNGTSQNLTFRNNNTTNYVSRSILWMASNGTNGVANVHIKNTKLEFSSRNSNGQLLTGIFVGSNALGGNNTLSGTAATAIHSNITMTNNAFTNIRQGIVVRGNTNPALRSNQINIVSNSIGSANVAQKPSAGIHISYVDAHNITDNNINGLADSGGGSTLVGGLRIENCNNYNVKRNIIKDVSTNTNYVVMYGIYAIGTNVNGVLSENTISNIKSNGAQVAALAAELPATISANMLIANNMIFDVATTAQWEAAAGIAIVNGKNIKVYHNTVSLNSTVNHISATLGILAGTELDVRNNIFVNRNTQGTRYSIYSAVPASAFTDINYNDYYSLQHVGYLGGDRTSLANWKTATGKDVNSINEPPTFTSTTNLRLSGASANNLLDNKGTFLAAVTIDIDDAVRSSVTPDMGADEFGAVNCSGTTTWNGTAWSNGIPTASQNAVFSANYTATADLHVCSIMVTSNAVVTIPTGTNVYLNNNLTVQNNANFILENNANLLQPTTATNSGNITVKRKSSALKRLDYVLWSSPVTSQLLGAFSPATTVNRFYTYNSASNVYSNIASPATTSFAEAKSYLIRMPNDHPDNTPTEWEGTFTGTPNNGDITVTVTPHAFTSVGNPYPSAIDADKFIGANNLSSPLYFWRKTNGSTTSAYATFTLAGGTGTGPSGIVNPAPGASIVPNGIIPIGQGFITRSVNTSINFDNGMRVGNQNGLFLRTSEIERNRIWLNLTGTDGIFSQTLVSYMTDATNAVDAGIDGLYFNDSPIALTTLIGADEYAIQGRQLPFDSADIIPVGFKTTVAGNFEISIDSVDGLFEDGQAIYLVDNLSGITHDLTTSYTFTTEAGIFNERFEITFESMTLGTQSMGTVTSGSIKIISDRQLISVLATGSILSRVHIYDITGRLVSQKTDINASQISIPVDAANQVLIIVVTDDNGVTTTKKIII